jgi:flavin-dependent dehydrogenase
MSKSSAVSDVTVIGGGLAGKAASLHLAGAGLRVTCILPSEPVRRPVGESLDWSAPDLLSALELPMEDLIKAEMATWKRHVIVQLRDGCSERYDPSPWLAGPPFHVELRTLHVDRMRLDEELLKKASDRGITLVPDKVVEVERKGKNISAVRTAGGARFSSPWFIDASGSAACLLAREFSLPAIQFGPPKVALWSYLPIRAPIEGTTLYMDPVPGKYLDWIWEIPINPQTVSVGYVTTGAAIKAERDRGRDLGEIFRQELMKFERFAPLLGSGELSSPNVTSFKCRSYRGVAGPNWLVVGEAAAMVDPMTSNGVTAALRTAAEASRLIVRNRRGGKLPFYARVSYSRRVWQMAAFFNGGIEKVLYEPPIRSRIGLRRAGSVYTSPAWSMNLVYTRLAPNGIFSTAFLGFFLGLFRVAAWFFYQICRRLTPPAAVRV